MNPATVTTPSKGLNYILLSWTPPALNGGGVIAGYRLTATAIDPAV